MRAAKKATRIINIYIEYLTSVWQEPPLYA